MASMEGNKCAMEIKNKKNISTFDKYWGMIKNGLFLFGLTNKLRHLGIEIKPYYWIQEEFEACNEPIVKGGSSNFSLRELSAEEFKVVTHIKDSRHLKKMIRSIENGQLCIALEDNLEIVAYTFVELKDFHFKGMLFKLEPNEAYLLNIWTFHEYRGRNLAPYLRYKVYKLLEGKGIDTKYSISDYFNKSSIKFKRKLNSKHIYLFLSISLFKKLKWNFKLKKYKHF